MNIHARRERRCRFSRFFNSLVNKANARDTVRIKQGFFHRHTRPYLDHATTHDIGTKPLGELPHGKNPAAMLCHKRRDKRESERVIFKPRQDNSDNPKDGIHDFE
ncbi:MAG: hypothetical protein BWY44_00377 [Candidatus Omnitrophica bacterium ADurb.Bin292]|nr:MAG: hypothetical protein BWY44_00377 [Candidatus Omnitrophica bacterium ADurb.Bin292]